MGNSQFDEKALLTTQSTFTDADTGVWQYLSVSPNNTVSSRTDLILIASNSLTPSELKVALGAAVPTDETTTLGSVTIPAGAGHLGVPAVNILAALFPANFLGGIALPNNRYLFGSLATPPSAGTFITVTAIGGEL